MLKQHRNAVKDGDYSDAKTVQYELMVLVMDNSTLKLLSKSPVPLLKTAH